MTDKSYSDSFARALLDSLLTRRMAHMRLFGEPPAVFEVTPAEWQALALLAPFPSGLQLDGAGQTTLLGVPVRVVHDHGISA